MLARVIVVLPARWSDDLLGLRQTVFDAEQVEGFLPDLAILGIDIDDEQVGKFEGEAPVAARPPPRPCGDPLWVVRCLGEII